MAEASLVGAIIAALAAIASAVAASRSARYARRVAEVEADRRHDELAPRLTLVPHKLTRVSDGSPRQTHWVGGLVSNDGPRQCQVTVKWDGEVRAPVEGDPHEPDAAQASGLVDRTGDSPAFVAALDLGTLAVGEQRFFQSANFEERRSIAFTFVCSDDEGRRWEKQLGMRWPTMRSEWPSSGVEFL